jgi:5-(carboxyamino)imidazole ribonucleotide synthase
VPESPKLGHRIGIVGGGQLARMLALKAHQIGFTPVVFAESPHEPAAQVAPERLIGTLNDEKQFADFLSRIDVLTFESEFVDTQLLKERLGSRARIAFPSQENMARLSDRRAQKKLLVEHKLPTAPFIAPTSWEEMADFLRRHPRGAVAKKRRLGYDGNGTFVLRDVADLVRLKNAGRVEPDAVIVEAFCPFRRELAVLLARSRDGNIVSFPLVESFQENSRCLWVKGPARHAAWPRLEKCLRAFVEELKYVGVIAFELFDMGKELLINETAPRVHNTGHFSQDALDIDQFEMHLRAVAGAGIAQPRLLQKAFCMYNLLGDEGTAETRLFDDPEVRWHWYGKARSRPGRKMGHINMVGDRADALLQHLKKVRAKCRV